MADNLQIEELTIGDKVWLVGLGVVLYIIAIFLLLMISPIVALITAIAVVTAIITLGVSLYDKLKLFSTS